MIAKSLLPNPRKKHKLSFNDFWSWVLDNPRAVQQYSPKITVLAAAMGKSATYNIATTS
jgi:hypothetical protein